MDKNKFEYELFKTMDLFKTIMQKVVEPLVSKEGISLIQAFILFRIKENKVCTIGDLCKDYAVNQGNISSLCKKMEINGLIKRNRSEQDERVVFVSLTEKGLSKIEKIYNNFDELNVYLTDFSKEQFEIIINGMQEFNQLLKLISDNKQ